MADPFTTLKALWGGEMGTEGAEPYQGGASAKVMPWELEKMTPEEQAKALGYQGALDTDFPDVSAMSEEQFNSLLEGLTGKGGVLDPYGRPQQLKYPLPSGFNIEEAVARHQASVERPSEVVRAYHGTTEGPVTPPYTPEQRAAMESLSPSRFRLPQYQSEKGVFFTPDPGTASQYASSSYKGVSPGSKVFPVDLDMQNSVTVDLKKLGVPAEQRWYDSRIVNTAIEAARQNNRDFVVIKGMKDIGGEADQIIAVRPSGKVRSALTGETLFGMLAGLFGVGGPKRKNGNGQNPQNPVTP